MKTTAFRLSEIFRTEKTKYWLGLLMSCMVLFGYASGTNAPMACDVPEAPMDITFSSSLPTNTTISYQDPVIAPTGYVIFRSTSNVPPVLTDGTVYTVNQTQPITSLTSGDNTYFCIYNNTGLSGTASGLTANTLYYYFVFSRNGTDSSSCVGAPVYSPTALTGSWATIFAAPTSFATNNIGFDQASISWNAPPVGGENAVANYFVEVYTSLVGTTYSNPIPGSPFDAGTDTSYTLSGLAQATTYFIRVTANNGTSNSPYLTGAFATTQPGQVGSGITVNQILPATSDYNYSYNQQIYTKAQVETNLEVGQTVFTKIKFFYNGGESLNNGIPGAPLITTNFDDWTIYIGNTSKTSFSSTSDWIAVADMQQHFSGIVTFPAAGNWLEITLDTPFEWDGQSNIVVAVDENAGGVNYFQPVTWRSFASESNTGIYYRSYTTNPDPENPPSFASGLVSALAQIVFDASGPTACEPPTQLGAISSSTTAELFWTSSGTLFEIEYGLENFTLGSGTPITGITENQTILTDLIFDTHYHYYVRQDCGNGDFSAWTGPYQFYTNYCEAYTLNSWAEDDITSFITTGGVANISNNTDFSSSPDGYGDFTDMFVSHFETGEVNFTVTTNETLYGVNIWVDWNNNMIFEETEKIYSSETANAGPFTGTISVPSGTLPGNYRIRIRGIWADIDPEPCGIINYGETEDYTFTVLPIPDCFPPFVLTSTNISATSVSLNWQADGNLFDIEYGPQGFTPGTGTIISGVGNPYVLSGLTPGITYDYYVRQDCGNDNGVSIWNGPVTFTFGAFEGNVPTFFNTNPQVSDQACATSFDIEVPDGYYLSALNVKYSMASINPFWTSHQRSVLYSPTLEIGEPQVVEGETDFAGVINYNRDVSFANGATGTIEFALKAWRTSGGTGCSTAEVYVIDDTWILTPTFELIPTCSNPPADLGYTNITEDSVDLIWTVAEPGVFQIQWGNVGFNPETSQGTTISEITTTSYTLTGLDSSIPYEFYVRRDCSADDQEDYGEWVGPVKFNAGYCLPSSTLSHYISSFSTTSALENIAYTSNSINGNGYGNKTDLVVSQLAGDSFNFSTSYVGGQSGVRIWVDWNNDFVFDDDEEVFYLGSTNGTKTGSIVIPADKELGNYVMRVRTEFGTAAYPAACGNIEYGEALDFTLSVTCFIGVPTGSSEQQFAQGETLSDLDVMGIGLTWYADEDLTTELTATTLLVHGTTYYATSSDENCESEALAITVTDICSGFQAPTATSPQMLTEGQTVADIAVTDVIGTLNWYSDEDLTIEIEESMELVEGTYTFWVTQTDGDCTSTATEITVEVSLSRNIFDQASFRVYPNPVKEVLNISYNKDITGVAVINMLGQVVISQTAGSADTQVDMSVLPRGGYLVKVTVDGIAKTIKVIKQ